MGHAPQSTWPSPLTGAKAAKLAALDWSFATGPALSALMLEPPPFPLDPPRYLQAYETISSLPDRCNIGLILLAKVAAPPTDPPAPLPRHLTPPEGYALAGIAAARRATTAPHPFARHFGPDYRMRQQAAAALVLGGADPQAASVAQLPRLMLRCLLRRLALEHPRLVRPFAACYDRPLLRHLTGV